LPNHLHFFKFSDTFLEITSQNGQLTWNLVIRDEAIFTAQDGYVAQHGLSMKVAGQKQLSLTNEGLSIQTDLGNYLFPLIQITGTKNPKLTKNSPHVNNDELQLISPDDLSDNNLNFDLVSLTRGLSDILNSLVSITWISNRSNSTYSPDMAADTSSNLKVAVVLDGLDWNTDWDNLGLAVTSGPDGSIFVTGTTMSASFPITAGAYDTTNAAEEAAFITKIDPTDGHLVYSTFLGGQDTCGQCNWTLGEAIAVDQSGQAYVSGVTCSGNDFPATSNAILPVINGLCPLGFLAILNATGDHLVYASHIYVNHTYADVWNVALDSNGNVYMLAETEYYVGSYPNTYLVNYGTALALKPGSSSFEYSTPLGNGFWSGMTVNNGGQAYFAGYTKNPDPFVSGSDGPGLVASVSNTGGLVYSVTVTLNKPGSIAVDSNGYAYITDGTNLAILDAAGNAQYTEQVVPSGGIAGSIQVDSQGSVYLIGNWCSSNTFPATAGAVWTENSGCDMFIIKLTPGTPRQSYSISYATLLGGTAGDTYASAWWGTSNASAVDNQGNVYVTGITYASNFMGSGSPSPLIEAVFAVKVFTGFNARVPLIFVPGVGGSQLYNNGGEQWPRVQYLVDCLYPPNHCTDDPLLLELRLASDGFSPYADNPVYTTTKVGEVLRLETVNVGSYSTKKDIYDTTFKALEAAGYQENVDLFPFPYDWRKDINWNGDQLLSFIDQVRQKTGASQVDILTHSMGGLLARAVLAKQESVGKVRRVLTMAAPVLGAPKLLGILEYKMPCFTDVTIGPIDTGQCLINPATLQEVITNFPSVYQVLPGPIYDQAGPSPLNIDYDTNGDGIPEGPQSYAQWTAIVSADRNATLMGMNAPFHNAYDNLRPADPAVQFIRVVGDDLNTPVQIREYKNCFLWVFNCQIAHEVVQGTGDNTVPIHSADLYNPDKNFDFRNGLPNLYAHKIGHSDLAINASVLAFATCFFSGPFSASTADLYTLCAPTGASGALQGFHVVPAMLSLSGNPNALGSASASDLQGLSSVPQQFGGAELETLGSVTGFVTDSSGNFLGYDSSDLQSILKPAILGGSYNAISDTQSFFLNNDGTYIGHLMVVNQGGARLRVRSYANGQLTGQAVFNIEEPIGAKLQITFATGQDPSTLRLQIDSNGDGIVDEVKAPDSWVTGSAANDRIPPVTTATMHWVAPNQASLVLTGTDEPGGSGVAATYYRLGTTGSASLYTAPINLVPGTLVQFFSVDRAGNTELIQMIQTVPVDIKPGSFPNSINLNSNGKTPVAILGTANFDVKTINPQTLTVAGAPVLLKPNGAPMAELEDVNGDGYMDLVIQVSTQAMQLDATSTEAVLQGKTYTKVILLGADSVKIVP
jgi:pimeloyl-ACP methyl ester carboxylesterase